MIVYARFILMIITEEKLLNDFLGDLNAVQPSEAMPKAKKKGKTNRKNPDRQPTLKQKLLVNAYLDKSNTKTFGNQTQSALSVYNTTNTEVARCIARQTLQSQPVQNYLEQKCQEMGMGIEVRLSTLRSFIAGQGYQKTTVNHYTPVKDEDGKPTEELVLSRRQEIIAPVRVHDRIRAIAQLNTMTGYYKQQEIDKQVALREVDDMYNRIVQDTGKRETG